MITYTEFWIFSICLLGAVQCFLLAGYFLLLDKGYRHAHRLFAALMLLIGVRLVKSGHYLFAGETLPDWWMNLGFAAHLAAGPLVYLYLRSHLKRPVGRKAVYLHLLPTLILVLLAPCLTNANFWYVGGYHTLLTYTLIYLSLSIHLWLRSHRTEGERSRLYWIPSLLFGVGIFFLAYFSNYVLHIIPYAAAPVLYSLAIFPISISAWRHYPEFIRPTTREREKYENLNLDSKVLNAYAERIIRYLERERAHLDPGFDLKKLAEATAIPGYILSMTMNQHLGVRFSQLINDYRVEEACRLLRSADHVHYTIAAIAFEVGFNSLSVFNQHFKRKQGLTPSAYRNRQG